MGCNYLANNSFSCLWWVNICILLCLRKTKCRTTCLFGKVLSRSVGCAFMTQFMGSHSENPVSTLTKRILSKLSLTKSFLGFYSENPFQTQRIVPVLSLRESCPDSLTKSFPGSENSPQSLTLRIPGMVH